MPGTVLQETVERYNSFVTSGVDTDFKKPKPMYKIEKPPFYAAWATPILHDSLTGLRVNTDQQVIDIFGKVIPGLYTGGESMGGLAQHGLGRDLVSGRLAGLHAGRSSPSSTRLELGSVCELSVVADGRAHERQNAERADEEPQAHPTSVALSSSACCGGRRRHRHRLEGQGLLPLRMRPSRTGHQRHGARWRRRGRQWACRICRQRQRNDGIHLHGSGRGGRVFVDSRIPEARGRRRRPRGRLASDYGQDPSPRHQPGGVGCPFADRD